MTMTWEHRKILPWELGMALQKGDLWAGIWRVRRTSAVEGEIRETSSVYSSDCSSSALVIEPLNVIQAHGPCFSVFLAPGGVCVTNFWPMRCNRRNIVRQIPGNLKRQFKLTTGACLLLLFLCYFFLLPAMYMGWLEPQPPFWSTRMRVIL